MNHREFQQKSSVDEIRRRFDQDVDRFSNLQTGQSSTVDAPLALELVVDAAARLHPAASHVLDVGCGAGNYTLKLLQRLPNLDVTLIDLSLPMLERAVERIQPVTSGKMTAIQGDIRSVDLDTEAFDVVMAAAVLHHLRGDEEWEQVFAALHRCLKPGGSLWIVDLITHVTPAVQELMWERYGAYLTGLKGEGYRDEVFAYIAKEDTPRSLIYQMDLLRHVGFEFVEVLHKNMCFAAFGGVKGASE